MIEQIRPYLQADGGDVKFFSISFDKIVYVELQRACHSCPMATMTSKNGVEATMKKLSQRLNL